MRVKKVHTVGISMVNATMSMRNKTEPIVLSGSGPVLLNKQTGSLAQNEEYTGGSGYIYGFDLSG